MKSHKLIFLLLLCLFVISPSYSFAQEPQEVVTFTRGDLVVSCRHAEGSIHGYEGTNEFICWASGITPSKWRQYKGYANGYIDFSRDIRTADPRYTEVTAEFDDLTDEEKCESLENSNPNECSMAESYSTAPNGCSGPAPQFYQVGGFRAEFDTAACNPHDICYSDLESSKAQCDGQFATDLQNECNRAFGPDRIERRRGHFVTNIAAFNCKGVAQAMSTGLNYPPLISSFYFYQARDVAACKEWKSLMEENDCE